MSRWPFGTDAKENDPLTAFRIPVVSSPVPDQNYPASYLDVSDDTYGWHSSERPTDAEARKLASFIDECRDYWNPGQRGQNMLKKPLDVDDKCNPVVFIKYGTDDWGYRRESWTIGPYFIPEPPGSASRSVMGPLSLAQLMDYIHGHGDRISPRWAKWKNAHPDVFGG